MREGSEDQFLDPTPQEYYNEPIIQKLIRQQEEMNRFKDICNPGISYGFYHLTPGLIKTNND